VFAFSVSYDIAENYLDKNRNHHHDAIVMNDMSHIGRPAQGRAPQRERAPGDIPLDLCTMDKEKGAKEFPGQGVRASR
jgi:hypothetical protein